MDLYRSRNNSGALAHIHGLDGLRALAVIAVFVYHIGLPGAPGGFLGVDLFFVLSGFLITDILLSQYKASGFIDIAGFWLRRARRLLPALVLMLICVTAWILLLAPGRASLNWPELPAAMFYYSNWYLIFHEVSYFEQFGPPSPFGHLWSLAIEGQFYLLWPIILVRFLNSFKRKQIIVLTAAITLFSAAAMILLYVPGADPSRVYYGTDTRMFALLAGALSAMLLHGKRLPEALPVKKKALLEASGMAGLAVVLLMIFKINQYSGFTYQGGLLLFSVAAACLVSVTAHPASVLGKLLEFKPLKWIGECSYGIYLWHFPVIILTSPAVNTSGPGLSLTLVQVTITLALAAVSRYLIEDPVRYGRLKPQGRTLARPQRRTGRAFRAAVRISAISFIILLTPLAAAEESSQLFAFDHLEQTAGPEAVADADVPAEPEATAETREITGDEITVIGDSLMVGVQPYLEKRLPGVTVDAKKSRQMRQALELIADLKETGELKKIVVIELGTNGPFTENQLADVLSSLADAEKIIFINARVPRNWEAAVNETLERVLKQYPKTTLIDWYSESGGHDEYFYDDGVHLRPAGAEIYCSLIVDAL